VNYSEGTRVFEPLNAENPALVISLDFELHWGILDHTPADQCGPLLMSARQAIPRILDLFERYEIRATWATVGALFCEGKEDLFERMSPEPGYLNPKLGIMQHHSSFGESEADDPLHFAPSLIRRILEVDGQEVGTHTFSHIYGCEKGVTIQDFKDDLLAAIQIAREWGIDLRSIVFPRNQFNQAMLDFCATGGITTYRGCPDHWAWRDDTRNFPQRAIRLVDSIYPVFPPVRVQQKDLTDVGATLFFRTKAPLFHSSSPLMRRIKAGLDRAVKEKTMFHLWWHPHNFGVRQEEHLAALEEILIHFSYLREEYGMNSFAMQDFQRWTQISSLAP